MSESADAVVPGSRGGVARRTGVILAWAAVVVATIAGGWLRFYGLGTPSLWFDEILHYNIATRAEAEPWHAWLTGFEFENGPLFYGSLLAGRIDPSVERSDRLAAALAGTATIPLVALAGLLAGGPAVGAAAAWLLAVAPFHVFYSREGRPYSLLTFFSALLLLALLAPNRRQALRIALPAALALAYLAVSGFQVLAGGMLAAVACAIVERRRRQRAARGGWWAIAAAGAGGILLLLALYGRYPRGPQIPAFPEEHARLLLYVLNGLAASPFWKVTVSPLTPFFAAAALIGLATLLGRGDAVKTVAVAGFGLAVAMAVWCGMAIPNHFFTLRYFAPVLPPFLVLTALGIVATGEIAANLVERLQRRPASPWFVPSLAMAATLTLVALNFGPALAVPYRKADWKSAARAIVHDARHLARATTAGAPGAPRAGAPGAPRAGAPGAPRAGAPGAGAPPRWTVLAAGYWPRDCLRFYLRGALPAVAVEEIDRPRPDLVAPAGSRGGCWLARGGFPQPGWFKSWVRPFPVLWHGQDESIGIFRCAEP